MHVEIREDSPSSLEAYASVPIAFEVRECLVPSTPDAGLRGIHLVAEPVRVPYVKDYDAAPDRGPLAWATRFDVTRWGVLSAWAGSERVGGAAVIHDAGDVEILEHRTDLAVLWDVRVAPEWRGRGVGSALFRAAEAWAFGRGATWLEIETQNVNVPACRFYARQGCELGAVRRFAYPKLLDEVQLLWYKRLGPAR